jgi:hypothetical protein
MDSEPFIKIAVLENDIEAQILTSIFDERKIPHRMRSFHDTAYDGLFQVQKGWGEVYAPAARKSDILGILNEIRSQDRATETETQG